MSDTKQTPSAPRHLTTTTERGVERPNPFPNSSRVYAEKDGIRVPFRAIEVTGCDVFAFRSDKIVVKNSYRKQRT